MVKKYRKQRKYSLEFKNSICKRHFENHESLTSLAKEIDCSKSVVFVWLSKYEKTGIEGISTDGRGKSCKGKERPKTRFNSIEEELNYVKAERDVLKKFSQIQRRSIKKSDFKPFPN